MKIILASSSPRRRQLLTQAGLQFEIMAAEIDESVRAEESPADYIQRMVRQKAQAAIADINTSTQSHQSPLDPPILLLTADTIGILPDGQSILIKPTDKAHAFRMWQQMSGSTHQVCTAVQATLLASPKSKGATALLTAVWQQQIIECTEVTFVPLTDHEMQCYWRSGEPKDKAGGYAIQGGAAAWVSRINGSYTNVVGLPLAQTLALIDYAKAALLEHEQ